MIQTTHTTQQQKNKKQPKRKKPQSKNGQKTEVDIYPKKTHRFQQAHEKMLNIANY